MVSTDHRVEAVQANPGNWCLPPLTFLFPHRQKTKYRVVKIEVQIAVLKEGIVGAGKQGLLAIHLLSHGKSLAKGESDPSSNETKTSQWCYGS